MRLRAGVQTSSVQTQIGGVFVSPEESRDESEGETEG